MTMPPGDVAPDELWAKLLESPRPHEVIDFPRLDPVTQKPIGRVAIWILTHEESMSAQKAAMAFVKASVPDAKADTPGHAELYRNAAAMEVISRACRRANDLKQPAFPSPALMRKHLTADEMGVLSEAYARVQARFGPFLGEMTVTELEAWTDVLVKGGEENLAFLDFCTSGRKNQLIAHLAFLLRGFLTLSSSSGAPAESGSTESSRAASESMLAPESEAAPLDDAPVDKLDDDDGAAGEKPAAGGAASAP